MNTVLTILDHVDEWYQSTYICCECEEEFMTYCEKKPRYCPNCGVKFDAIRIRHGGRTETIYINDEKEEEENEEDVHQD